ncbi:b(0,+)-type amino acid transporter 1-like [Lineus longissimus]|uniref:b(0,+)-type amino acid transporter 1-like n=1 Tax=Lineus longissimus TaxID=88925 RepID=UPI00315DAEE5
MKMTASPMDPVRNEKPPVGEMENTIPLKKQIGLTTALSFIIGSVIGSGIFISPKGIVEGVGSVGATLCIWMLCGLISISFACIYAELGTIIHVHGGDYIYIVEAFRDKHKFFGPLPGFLNIWMKLMLQAPASMAVLALAFSHYITDPLFPDGCGPPEFILKTIAVTTILTVTMINVYSISMAASVQNIFTAIKTAAVVMISVVGIIRILQGQTDILASGFEGTVVTAGSIAIACYKGLWAYGGSECVNIIAEEIINPRRNIPLGIFLGLGLVTMVYMLTNVSYFTVLSPAALVASGAVAVSWGEEALGVAAFIIPISVCCSVFGALNGSMFSNGRSWFAAGREGHLPSILSMVHVERVTPAPAIIFQAVMALIYMGLTDIFTLINYAVFAEWVFRLVTIAACIVFRFTMKDAKRKFTTPNIILAINILIGLFLTVVPIVNDPRVEFLYATLLILFGVVFYVPLVYYRIHIPFSDDVCCMLQVFMEVVPTKKTLE